MTFFDQHGDAFGVALILSALFVVALVLMDRAYTRTANAMRRVHRELRGNDRAAYWRLHHRYTALCSAGVTVEQAAAQAEVLTAVDEPIPYLPVFTEGEAS